MEDQPIGEERVNPSTLSVVLTNLEIFTLYRVDVLGYTIMGNGPSATDYAGVLILIVLFIFAQNKRDLWSTHAPLSR